MDAFTLVDTFGVLSPQAATYFTKTVKKRISKPLEIHFHSGFGMGVANTVNAVLAGGEVIHTTVLGIGERAGNTPMEETVMALRTMYDIDVGINYGKMNELAQLVKELSGVQVPTCRPFVGEGAYTMSRVSLRAGTVMFLNKTRQPCIRYIPDLSAARIPRF